MTMLSLYKGCAVRGVQGGSKQQLEEAVRFMGSRELASPMEKEIDFNRGAIIAALEHIASGDHIGKICISIV